MTDEAVGDNKGDNTDEVEGITKVISQMKLWG